MATVEGTQHGGEGRFPLRLAFSAELDQLRLQVEVMAVRVDQNLERMRSVLHDGDLHAAEQAVNADDDIDAMSVSLTSRCYDLLAREQPVASDLRLIVSVLRVLGEFERVGDLALRVVKLAPERDLIAANPRHLRPASRDERHGDRPVPDGDASVGRRSTPAWRRR